MDDPLKGGLTMRLAILAIGIAALVSACAGRSPQPVAVVQPQDQFSDCAAIMAEVEANNRKVQELAEEKGLKTTQNVAAGVAGIFIPVLWFGMDWQGTQDKETAARRALVEGHRLAAVRGTASRSAQRGASEPASGRSCNVRKSLGQVLVQDDLPRDAMLAVPSRA